MFRIGEFSKLTRVSIRMLRYYDETGLLKPAKTDVFTGYRLYSAEQIYALNKILFLRDLGFTVSEIASTLNHWDNDHIAKLLEDKRAEIEKTIQDEQNRLLKIDLAKMDIEREKIMIHYNVSIKSVPAYQVFSLRRVVRDYYAEAELWKEMSDFAEKHKFPVSDNTFTIYHDTEYKENDVDIEICAPAVQMGKDSDEFRYRMTEPVPVMAYTFDIEDYRTILEAPKPYKKGPALMGIFSTRSPMRPNPIALSTVQVLNIDHEKGIIEIAYIDAHDGTPLIDIKPYTPSMDRVENPSVPKWCGHWPKSYEQSGDFDWQSEFNF